LTEQDLLDYCRDHLPGPKRPKAIHLTDRLPRTESGKMLRRELQQWFRDSAIEPDVA
jgi:acyl-CoA synthetase (AMP-forming)/AMP-acid ligase II